MAQAHVDGPPSFTPEYHQLVYPPKSTIQTTQMDHQTLLNRGFRLDRSNRGRDGGRPPP